MLASNISPEIDYTVSSLSMYSDVRNSLLSELNTNTFTQNTRLKLNWTFWEGFILTGDLTHTVSNGQSAGYNQNFVMLNLGIGKKFLPNDAAEIRLSVFDVLKQNVSNSRTSNELYIEDSNVQVLQRYALLTFSYTLRSFTGGFAKETEREREHGPGEGRPMGR
ncbi:MAG: outer membrane beta-barrel protein [Ignavibacteria bacterium]|nr:outer membrane beta-barrel protein [Ignavibacteria bacterium]